MSGKLPNHCELLPAYGREYKNKKDVVADFVKGLDWIYASTGQYTSIKDCSVDNSVLLRYKDKREVCSYKVTGKEAGLSYAPETDWSDDES